MSVDTTPAGRIVGRETELGWLRTELAAAMQGSGRLVLLSGEPGIGKTTLASAHGAEAESRGALVVWGRCHEVPGAPTYWPWIQLLDALERGCGDELEAHAEDLRGLLLELHAESGAALQSGEAHAHFELLARVARTLGRVAAKRGIVAIIDDLHWADPSSVRLLRFLASELSTDPILMVATLRAHERASGLLLAELARLGRSIPVGPLERSSVERLLVERLPETTGSRAGLADDFARDALVSQVWERSDGNPFFVLELAQLISAELSPGAEMPGSRSGLPAGVKTVLEKRLSALPEDSRETLQAASVIGRVFDLPTLAQVVERDADSLHALLEPAIGLGLLSSVSGAVHRFGFAHALTREALYESLGARAASTLHGRVGEALEATVSSVDREDRLPVLAHHFSEAAPAVGPAKGALYGLAAGRRTLSLSAYEEAAGHFERTLTLLASGGVLDLAIEARIGLGEALVAMGERERGESVAREAVDLARAKGDATLHARAVLCWTSAREEGGFVDVEINGALERAIACLGEGEPSLRARLFARLAAGLYLVPGADSRRRALMEAATELAEAGTDRATVSEVRFRALSGLLGPEHLDERLRAIDALLADARGQPIAELRALTMRVDACAEKADRRGLDHALAAFEQKARFARHPYFRWSAASFKTAMALVEGRYEDAEEAAAEALRLGAQTQERTPSLQFAQQMFMLRGWQNRLEEVAPLVEGGAETARVVEGWRCALADLYELLGRREDARREFEAVAVDDFASLPRDSTWLTSMVLAAGVCARLADVSRAEVLYGLLSPFAGRIAVATPLVVMVGPVDTRLAILAGLLGRYDEAEAHFAAATALAERMRALTWQADARYYHAEMLWKRGAESDVERAGKLLDEACAIARTIGMQLLLDWGAELRGSDPAAHPSPSDSTSPHPRRSETASFRRDGEIWTLVFDGRTTRMRAIVGLSHLCRLLAEPGREVHALDLVAGGRPPAGASSLGDAGEALDARARSEYEARLRDVQDELEEAERNSDRGRADRLGEEREALLSELARGFGLGGRARREGSAAERARLSVTRAIKYAISKIEEHDRGLAQVLERDVRTGTYCVYAPAERDRISWQL